MNTRPSPEWAKLRYKKGWDDAANFYPPFFDDPDYMEGYRAKHEAAKTFNRIVRDIHTKGANQ